MRQIDAIRAAWHEERHHRKLYASPTLDQSGLMLGASTILAKRVNGVLDLDNENTRARVLALLTAAYGPEVRATVLGNIGRAAKAEREGEYALAAIHLAQAGLPPIGEDQDACHRLFLFEKLIEVGTEPQTILRALRPADDVIERANPYHDRPSREISRRA